jgi:hypothetical protein
VGGRPAFEEIALALVGAGDPQAVATFLETRLQVGRGEWGLGGAGAWGGFESLQVGLEEGLGGGGCRWLGGCGVLAGG